jgi:hypothetical protein
METKQSTDTHKIETIKQLLNINKPEVWQKIDELLQNIEQINTIEQKLGKELSNIPDKVDLQNILKNYQAPRLDNILGILPNEEPLENWLSEIE